MIAHKTVAYKGSKKKLLKNIYKYVEEIDAKTFFDGFSGSGIVSSFMREKGLVVLANDLNYSSYIFGKVFLQGFDENIVSSHIEKMNSLQSTSGWLTENYSGTKYREAKRSDTVSGEFPLAFTKENAMKIDAARDYVESLSISKRNKNALIFSCILASNEVINNTADQKSSFKKWLPKALKDVHFKMPTMINGPEGIQISGNIMEMPKEQFDVVYLDPPYSNSVLYSSCYHINDSIAIWDKPILNYDYALPRPERAVFLKGESSNKTGGHFYSSKSIKDDFSKLFEIFSSSKRIIVSYSDAPKNLISIEDLVSLANQYGSVKVEDKEHRICTQFKKQNKQIEKLKEYFIVVDTK